MNKKNGLSKAATTTTTTMLRDERFLAERRRRREGGAPPRRLSTPQACYFASHVLEGWAAQDNEDGGGGGGAGLVEALRSGIAADLISGDRDRSVLQRCLSVMLVEWEQGSLPTRQKVHAALHSKEYARKSRDRAHVTQAFRGMDQAFEGLYMRRRSR